MSRGNYLNSRANLKAVRVPDRPDYLHLYVKLRIVSSYHKGQEMSETQIYQ